MPMIIKKAILLIKARILTKWKLTVEYNGAEFCGWQSQPSKCGVQDAIEEAIKRIEGRDVRLSVAGRTDSGVHALGQVASADFHKDWIDFRLMEAINAHLRNLGKVAIIKTEKADDEFDARFSAKSREYIFIMQNRRASLTVNKGLVWRVPMPLNVELMHEAAQELLGQHDFSTFRDAECQAKSPIKTLDIFDIKKVATPFGEQIHCHLKAKSFLHRQVRSMVGTLVEVGRGAWSINRLVDALESKDRAQCGQVAPPDGLYLSKVNY